MATYPEGDPQAMYDVAAARLQHQFDFADAIDDKISTMFGWGSGDLAILVAILALHPRDVHRAAITAVVLSATAYAVMAAAVLIGVMSRKWNIGPSPTDVLASYQTSDDITRRWDLARQLVVAYTQNETAFNTKKVCLRFATGALILQTVALLLVIPSVA